MRNYSFIFAVLFFTYFTYGQTQSGTIIYKVRGTIDLKKATEKVKDADVKDALLKILTKEKETAPYLSCRLDFNCEESIFQRINEMANDNGMDLNDTYEVASGYGGSFYTNLNENISLNDVESFGKDLLVQRNLDSLDWHITKETKKIKGYLCHKAEVVVQINAIHKGTVTAWFTTEIPFQFGPLQFAGLPGMILGLERNHFYFYADKITFSEKDKTVKRLTKGESMTLEEFFEDIKKIMARNGGR